MLCGERRIPRLCRASNRDDALASLTVGLTTLSVRIQNRRTVFVESEYDEDALQELYRLLRPKLDSDRSLDFVASGRGGQGNSQAVKYLVRTLRDNGNDSIFGVIDKDSRDAAPPGVLFNTERYSLENIAFDPFILGAFLLRESHISSEALGLQPGRRHFDLGADDAQAVIDAISGMVCNDHDDRTSRSIRYAGGFEAELPNFWLTLKGHDLETRLRERFPTLNGYGNGLPLKIITKGFADLPDLVPYSVLSLLQELLDD